MSVLLRAVAAVVAVTVVAGCGGEPPVSGSRTSNTPVPPTISPVVVPASSCPATHPVPLMLRPETMEEARIAGKLIGCTNRIGTSTYFENRDDSAVWTMDPAASSISLGLKVQAFREAMPQALQRRTLEPGQSATINAAATSIRLTLDPQVQSAWQALSAFADTVADAAETRLKRLLSAGSKSRKATIDCAAEGFKIGQEIAKAGDSRAPEDLIETGLAIFDNAKACGKSIKAARAEGVVTAEELSRELKSSSWRSSTNTIVKITKLARGVHI